MRVAKLSGLVPILRFAVLPIWSEHAAALLYRVEIEGEFVRHGKEPDVFRRILPIRLCPATLFTFPGDPVAKLEILRPDSLYRRTRPPITADVNTRRWL